MEIPTLVNYIPVLNVFLVLKMLQPSSEYSMLFAMAIHVR